MPRALLATIVAALACSFGPSTLARAETDLAAIARDMYVFTFPLHENYRVRHLVTQAAPAPQRVATNAFLHRRDLVDHTSRRVTTPNNDTLYSQSFLDLSRGPVVLEVPEVAERYYTFALMDFYSNNFAYVGTRTTGTAAGKHLVAGPGWRGTAPDGMHVIASPTNAVWMLGRILVTSPEDLPRVRTLQDRLKLYSLSESGPAPVFDGPPLAPGDPWGYVAIVNHALTENPPPARDAAAVARFAAIGVGPGLRFDRDRISAEQQAAIVAGIKEGERLVAAKELSGTVVQGWSYPTQGMGNFGADFLLRAGTALKLLAALEPAEAVYLSYVGEPLDGSRRYRLRFDAGRLPPVHAFYEAMPDKRLFFADNPIKRYAIGDRTPGLRVGANGSLDIDIRHDSPGTERESNWLPAPAGPFALVLRAYVPKPELLDGRYRLPALEREP